MEKIKSIYLLKNAFIKNTHNNCIFDKQEVLVIEYDNKSKSYIDMKANQDITNIDYFEVIIRKGKTKMKKVFLEENRLF